MIIKNSQLFLILLVFVAITISTSFFTQNAYATIPNAPTKLKLNALSTTSIKLSWNPSTTSGINATGGNKVLVGNNETNQFTSSGTFNVTSGTGQVTYLVVGGGGTTTIGGGGGGQVQNGTTSVYHRAYTITVGGANTATTGLNVTAGGGANGATAHAQTGGSGAAQTSSGGGGADQNGAGGAGSQGGNAGGGGSANAGGGGGGCSGAGGYGNGNTGGTGGAGCLSSITGSSVSYGFGGQGANPASAADVGRVIISYQSGLATGYKIERSTNNSTWNTIAANTGNTTTTYTDTGLSTGTLYYYRVSGINGYGTSSPSNIPATSTLSPSSIMVDTINSTSSAAATYTQHLNVNVANNNNRLLIVGVSQYDASITTLNVTSIKIGSTQLTHGASITSVANHGASLWYYLNPPTGKNVIDITSTANGGTLYWQAGVYSLYNVKQTSTVDTRNSTQHGSSPFSITITPTFTGSAIFSDDEYDSGGASKNPSLTLGWNVTSAVWGGSQYSLSPTIGSKNIMQWSGGGATQSTQAAIAVKVSNSPPNPPSLNTVNTLTSSSIKETWTSVPSANWYLVYRESPLGGGFSQIANTTQTSYTDINLINGTQYNYEIYSGNGTGTSATPSNAIANYTLPFKPTNLVLTTLSTSEIHLAWTIPKGTTTGNMIEKSLDNSTWSIIYSNTGNSTGHYDSTGLPSNTIEYFRVTAINAGGSNGTTNMPTQTTIASAPTGLSASRASSTSISLSWTAPTGNGVITGYKIESSTNGGSSWTVRNANTGSNAVTYTDTGLTTGLTYTYRVSAINSGGTSSPSSTSSATTSNGITITAFWHDGTTPLVGKILQSNSTSSNNAFNLVNGMVTINGMVNTQNFTFVDTGTTGLYVYKIYNFNASVSNSITQSTNVFPVTCPSTNTVAVDMAVNETDGHRVSSTVVPSCDANNKITWKETNTGNGKSNASFSSILVAVLQTGFQVNPNLFQDNSTQIATSYNSGTTTATSSSFTIGQGTKTILNNYELDLGTSSSPTPPPSGGGGGGGGGGPITPLQVSTPTPTNTGTSQGITFIASNDILIPNKIVNETITITWPSNATMNVNSIEFGASNLQTRLINTPPYGLMGNSYGNSKAVIVYVLQVPQACSATISSNCIDPKVTTIGLPITLDVTLSGVEVSQTVTAQFNNLGNQSFPTIVVIAAIIFSFVGFFIYSNFRKGKKKIKATLNKEFRLENDHKKPHLKKEKEQKLPKLKKQKSGKNGNKHSFLKD